MSTFEQQGQALGALVDTKQKAYGNSVGKAARLFKIFLEDCWREDLGSYVIKPEMLDHILLQVRIVDKQNRIFSNPNGDLMNESPYQDIAGYGLLGSQKGVDANATAQNNGFTQLIDGNEYTIGIDKAKETTQVSQ